ncbi:MAG: GDSL family lipase [Syntrophomonadaceae bacterium]|nr:GDSL family lipase [Syntrophomonadaceae bacterium]
MVKPTIVCLGDSTTYGFPFGPLDSWVKILSEELKAEIINKGINGNTTTNMLYRFDNAVLKHKPHYVIITGGINDVVSGESLDRILHNITTMVEKAENHNVIPIIGLPTPVDFKPWEKVLQNLRQLLVEYANERNIALINFAQAFYNTDGTINTKLLLDDGGHPSREGYKQMFKQINLAVFNLS